MLQQALVEYEGCNASDEINLLQQFAEWLKTMRQTSYGVFVFSLSEEMSLLSQWRSYPPHRKGVSLGFTSDFFKGLLEHCEFRLAACVYEHEAKHELIKALGVKMFVSFKEARGTLDLSGEHEPTRYFKFLEGFILLQVLAIMKHSSFGEESEWR